MIVYAIYVKRGWGERYRGLKEGWLPKDGYDGLQSEPRRTYRRKQDVRSSITYDRRRNPKSTYEIATFEAVETGREEA